MLKEEKEGGLGEMKNLEFLDPSYYLLTPQKVLNLKGTGLEYVGHWDRRDPYIYAELTFDKEAKVIQWGEDICFNKWC